MASYFDELHVDEDEMPNDRIERLTRETFRMLFDHDPARYGDIINFQNTPPASKSEIKKLISPSINELSGKIILKGTLISIFFFVNYYFVIF